MKTVSTRILALSFASILGFSTGNSAALANDSQNPVSYIASDGTTTTFTPRGDSFGVTVQDARGITTQFEYNVLGQLLSEDAPERGRLSYGYDQLSRPIRLRMEGGITSRLKYDQENRVTRRIWQEGPVERITTRYTYNNCENGEGQLCRVTHNGHRTMYGYTEGNQLAFTRTRLADEDAVETMRYSYDADGRLSSMRYPSGLKVSYVYDETGHVEAVTGVYGTGDDRDRFTIVNAIAYDSSGRLESFRHGNGIITRNRYDERGRLARITRRLNGEVIGRDKYTYDIKGRIGGIERLDPVQSRQYRYDEMGRLVSEAHGDGTATNRTAIGYIYDEVGNRISRTVDGRSRQYDYAPDSNRLVRNGQQDLAYDSRGNLLEDRQGKRGFVYDLTNRMSAFYRNGELRSEYDYDAHGRRIRKRLHSLDSDGTRSIRFLYDTDGRLVSETSKRDDGATLHARDLVWLGSVAIAQVNRRVNADGSTHRAEVLSLHTDHLGAPRTATDETGTAVWQWHGDAFGANVGRTRAVDRDPDGDGRNVEVSLRFPGQYHDRESGLWYNHNRDYDSELGRYVQSDPLGLAAGPNRYTYVRNGPTYKIDPKGLLDEIIVNGQRYSYSHTVAVRFTDPGSYGGNPFSNDYGAEYANSYDAYEDAIDAAEREIYCDEDNNCVNGLGNPVDPVTGYPLDEIIVTGGQTTTPINPSLPDIPTSDGGTTGGTPPSPSGPTSDELSDECKALSPQEAVDMVNGFLDAQLGRRSPTDPVDFIRVADSINQLPPGIRERLFLYQASAVNSRQGWHPENWRLPSPSGSQGGWHLHTEEVGGTLYAHFDGYNGSTNTINHWVEIGILPSGVGIFFDDGGLGRMGTFMFRFNELSGPSTVSEIIASATIPTEEFSDYCDAQLEAR